MLLIHLEVIVNKLLGATLVSVFLAATSASVAFAQTAPNAHPPSRLSRVHRFMERPFSRPTERIEARLAYEKTALKITGAQQAQWDAYANFERKQAREIEQRFKSLRSDKQWHERRHRPNAIERLERTQSLLAEGVTRINDLLAVEKPLYAALSPEQRNVADVVLNPRLHAMERRFGHRHGRFERNWSRG
jgi:LTXXQ motif family protein